MFNPYKEKNVKWSSWTGLLLKGRRFCTSVKPVSASRTVFFEPKLAVFVDFAPVVRESARAFQIHKPEFVFFGRPSSTNFLRDAASQTSGRFLSAATRRAHSTALSIEHREMQWLVRCPPAASHSPAAVRFEELNTSASDSERRTPKRVTARSKLKAVVSHSAFCDAYTDMSSTG